MNQPEVVWLSETAARRPDAAGGKGASLATLLNDGFPVPDGFVVTTAAYRRAVDASDVGDELRRLAATQPPEDPTDRQDWAAALYVTATRIDLPTDLAEQVTAAYHEIGGSSSVAVRPSTVEDALPEAETYEAFCWVCGRSMVVRRIRDSWAALWTSRAAASRASRGIVEPPVLAVVVQHMVDVDRAGVARTKGTSTGGPSTVVVETALGLSEAVVGQLVEPDTYVVDAESLEVRSSRVGHQAFMIERECDGGTARRPLTAEQAAIRVLDGDQIRRVAQLAVDVSAALGEPVDVQWALCDQDLWLLQARPAASHSVTSVS